MTLEDVEKRLAAVEASNKALEASLHASATLQRLALGVTIGFIGWTIYQHLSRPSLDMRILDMRPFDGC